jgi:hypothetical protein
MANSTPVLVRASSATATPSLAMRSQFGGQRRHEAGDVVQPRLACGAYMSRSADGESLCCVINSTISSPAWP